MSKIGTVKPTTNLQKTFKTMETYSFKSPLKIKEPSEMKLKTKLYRKQNTVITNKSTNGFIHSNKTSLTPDKSTTHINLNKNTKRCLVITTNSVKSKTKYNKTICNTSKVSTPAKKISNKFHNNKVSEFNESIPRNKRIYSTTEINSSSSDIENTSFIFLTNENNTSSFQLSISNNNNNNDSNHNKMIHSFLHMNSGLESSDSTTVDSQNTKNVQHKSYSTNKNIKRKQKPHLSLSIDITHSHKNVYKKQKQLSTITENLPLKHNNNNKQILSKKNINLSPISGLNHSYIKKKNNNKINNYVFLKQLGNGSYASVKCAKHKITQVKYAVKIYSKLSLFDPQKKTSVKNEIENLKLLSHTNIVKFHEVIESQTNLYLIMEYVNGISLRDYINQKEQKLLNENETKLIFKQIVNAIKYCHSKHICHRDIKLENVLLCDKNYTKVKVIDFGFSEKTFNKNVLLKMFCGTPSYMAPEIIMKKKYIGQYVDIWSLGVLLYRILCGKFPFQGTNENELYQNIMKCKIEFPKFLTENAIELINKMLQFKPNDRISIDDVNKQKWFNCK